MTGTIRHFWHNLAALLCFVSVFSSTAIADDVKALIEQAYQRTSDAKTVEEYSEIIRLCREAEKIGLTKDQTDYVNSLLAWSHNRRGEVYTEQATQGHEAGQTQQAAQLDAKASADFEASLKLDSKRWKTWHNRAISRAIAGKYQEAIADFGKVIELKPDHANAWFNRGEIQYDLGQVEAAIKDYTESIRLNPQDAGALTSRAHSYFRLGQMDAALQDYAAAIELEPENADLLANRGDALQSLGKWLDAAADFNAGIKLNGESPRVLQSAAWLMATCPDEEVRHAEFAVQAAEKANELIGKPDPRYLDTLAAAYANANRFPEAVAKVTAAIQLAPSEQAAILKKRLEQYQQKKPYRQAAGEKTAGISKTKKTR